MKLLCKQKITAQIIYLVKKCILPDKHQIVSLFGFVCLVGPIVGLVCLPILVLSSFQPFFQLAPPSPISRPLSSFPSIFLFIMETATLIYIMETFDTKQYNRGSFEIVPLLHRKASCHQKNCAEKGFRRFLIDF